MISMVRRYTPALPHLTPPRVILHDMPKVFAGETIREPWISTPGYQKDRARAVHGGLLHLNDLIDKLVQARRLTTDSARYRDWKRTLERFGAWFGSTSDTSFWWSGTEATIEAWESTLRNWLAWYRATFPDASAELPAPPPNYKGNLSVGALPWGFWLAGAGVAAWLLLRSRR